MSESAPADRDLPFPEVRAGNLGVRIARAADEIDVQVITAKDEVPNTAGAKQTFGKAHPAQKALEQGTGAAAPDPALEAEKARQIAALNSQAPASPRQEAEDFFGADEPHDFNTK